jgi:hypothetical protein
LEIDDVNIDFENPLKNQLAEAKSIKIVTSNGSYNSIGAQIGTVSSRTYPLETIKTDAYGLGVHMDSTGRPVAIRGGAINSNIVRENAYGLGVHMDQYGAAVTIAPK